MVTLADVALEAGCTQSTVSRALHGNPRISSATRRRIEIAADRLGYVTNHVARSLQSGRTGNIGIVVPNLNNRYYTFCTAHLTSVLDRHGYKAFVCSHHFDAETDAKILRGLIERQVDGIVHVPCSPDGARAVLKQSDVPVVELGIRSNLKNVDSVFIDDHEGIGALTRYLTDLGHRRIALLVGRSSLTSIRAEMTGFRDALGDLDADLNPILQGPANIQWCREAYRELFTDRSKTPTAIIATHRAGAIAALLEFKELKIEIPTELSLVGYTNEDWYAVCDPPLTTFEHPYKEMALMAGQLLIDRLDPQPDADRSECIMGFGGKIIERSSAAPPIA